MELAAFLDGDEAMEKTELAEGDAGSGDEQNWTPPAAGYVLVVDDDLAVRDLLKRCLEGSGHLVKQAASADVALDLMAEAPASVVLCDIRMPGRDGLWLAERLRAEWPSTKIVMVTAIDDLQTIQQSRDLGAADYLTKPINRDQLQQVVARLASRPHGGEPGQAEGAGKVGTTTLPDAVEAEYALETPVRCPACGERTAVLKAIRLIRGHVNFTSTLPRRGRVLACPHCLAIVPGELTNF